MKILILSFYFYPDLCAGSFRATALVEQLKLLLGPGVELEIITTLPNRYASFSVDAPELDQQPGVLIRRIRLPKHACGMVDQAKAFAFFAKKVNQLVMLKEYALVFATSSRLMTAALGAWVAHRKKALLYLDIRDIFVDTIQDVLPTKLSIWAKPLFGLLERWSFTKASRINLVSKGFQPYFKARYPSAELSWFTNGIDTEFILSPNFSEASSQISSPLTVLYAGNIGEGQGLHLIIPGLAQRFEGRAQFKIVGDGGRKNQLVAALEVTNCRNVELLDPMNREQLIQAYHDADILFLHLNDYDAFRKVLPSKLFEYAAMGKPIWAGVAGYAAEFVQFEISNAAIFHPCNITEAESVFSLLRLETKCRTTFVEKYERSQIMKKMASDIISLV